MPLPAAASLLDALRTTPILRPAQLEELDREAPVRFPEARALAQHLLERGWLTPFQVNQLLLGRGAELVLGPYVLIERLGEGYGGQLFKARHHLMARIVALRVIRPELLADPNALAQFYQQVEAASQLTHDNVLHAYDAGPIGQTHFFAMEYVAGVDLARFVKQSGPLPVAQACSYVYQAALGLQHGFEHRLCHRGLKPSKLIVTRKAKGDSSAPGSTARLTQGRPAVVKIIGLGLSQLLRSPATERRRAPRPDDTEAASFLAPEQRTEVQPIDIRADIYSLGCCLHYLLTALSPMGDQGLPPLETSRPDAPPALGAVLARMTAADPAERFGTPAEVAEALHEFVSATADEGDDLDFLRPADSDPLASTTDVAATNARPRRWSDGWRWLVYVVIGAGLLLTGLALAYVFLLKPSSGSRPADPLATRELRVAADWKQLLARAENAPSDKVQLWHDIARFRIQYPGTPEAFAAAEWLTRLQSPYDRFDAQKVSADDRAMAGAHKELVAVLGEQRWHSWVPVRLVAVRPDGKVVAAVQDHNIVLWDAATGVRQSVIKTPSRINGVVFFDDGRLAFAGADKTVKVWDLAANKEQAGFTTTNENVSVAAAPDKKVVATGGKGGIIHTWKLADKKKQADLNGHRGNVPALAFAPDSTLLVSGGQDGTVRLWNVAGDKKKRTRLPGHENGVLCVAFSPDGTLVASGGADHHWRLSETATAKEVKHIKASDFPIIGLAFAPNGKHLATAGGDGVVRVWDVPTGKEHAKFADPDGLPLNSIAFAPDNQTVVIANQGHVLRLWNFTVEKKPEPPGHTRPILALACAADGLSIASTGADRSVRIWDIGSGTERLAIRKHNATVHALAYAPDGRSLASAGDDKAVRLWDVMTGNKLAELTGHKHAVRAVAFAPDGQSLATGSHDQTVKLWDTVTGTERSGLPVLTHGKAVIGLAFAPDGRSLVSVSHEQTLKVWDAIDGSEKFKLTGQSGEFTCVAFAPDGRTVATAGSVNFVRLLDPATGKETRMTGHRGGILSLAFSPDGKALVSAGSDGQIVLWKVAAGTMLRDWSLPGVAQRVAFAPDGRHLVTANANGTIYVLRLSAPGTSPY